MKAKRIIVIGISVIATAVASAGAGYWLGHRHGSEAGAWSQGEFEQVACATTALGTLGYLRDGREDAAMATLDATIDAGIAAHWTRLRAPSFYASDPASPTDLVEILAEHRRMNPSSASEQTPNLNSSVSEFLAHQAERSARDN